MGSGGPVPVEPAELIVARGCDHRSARPWPDGPGDPFGTRRMRRRLPTALRSDRVAAMNRGDAWRDKGGYFSWRPRAGDADEVQVFHVEMGDPDAPPLVLVHGFPTSSVDWFEVAERLSDRYRVCAMDFPGFGFSDKPLGWGYSLVRDVEVLEHYVAEVLGLESMIMLAHDRGFERGDDPHHRRRVARAARAPLRHERQHLPAAVEPHAGPAPDARSGDGPDAARAGDARAARGGHGSGDVHAGARCRRSRDPGADRDLLARRRASRSCTRRSSTSSSGRRTRTPGCRRSPRWTCRPRSSGASTTPSRRRASSATSGTSTCEQKPGRNSLYFVPDANHYLQNDRPDALVEAFLHALEAPDDTPAGRDRAGARLAAPGRPLTRRAPAVRPTS